VQGSWTAIRDKGRDGHQWWILEAFDAGREFSGDLHSNATSLGQAFARPLPQLIAATDPAHVQRWVIRDRKPLKQWSKGRATLVGDAAHPTSPYAGYGAGMATEDGYFIGRRLAGVDLSDYDAVRRALDAFEAPPQAAHRPAVPAGLRPRAGLPSRAARSATGPGRDPGPHPVDAEGGR
jgi:2-polyprenyl-6-methoxyphenol hydroxylase-like FAD-dependent oxidoreductase